MKGKTTPEQRLRAFALLQARYPNTFFHSPTEIKPLEIGIKGKLIADLKDNLPLDIDLRAIYVALHYYCSTKEYKKARKTVGTPRLNLAGQEIGEVSEDDLKRGQLQIAQRRQIQAAQLAQQRHLAAKKLAKKIPQLRKEKTRGELGAERYLRKTSQDGLSKFSTQSPNQVMHYFQKTDSTLTKSPAISRKKKFGNYSVGEKKLGRSS